LLVVAGGSLGIIFYDISGAEPVETSRLDYICDHFYTLGERIVFFNYDVEREVPCMVELNVSDPADPHLASIFEFPEQEYPDLSFCSIDFYGELLYAGTRTGPGGAEPEVFVFDFDAEEGPALAARLDLPFHSSEEGNKYSFIAVAGDRLYDKHNGLLEVYSLENSLEPAQLGTYRVEDGNVGINVEDNLFYISTGGGIWAGEDAEILVHDVGADFISPFPFDIPPSSLILSSFPNPFNSSTTISYSLPRPGRYELDVVDISGRLVTRLSNGWKEAGSYRDIWNANQTASGTFRIVLRNEFEQTIFPATLIK